MRFIYFKGFFFWNTELIATWMEIGSFIQCTNLNEPQFKFNAFPICFFFFAANEIDFNIKLFLFILMLLNGYPYVCINSFFFLCSIKSIVVSNHHCRKIVCQVYLDIIKWCDGWFFVLCAVCKCHINFELWRMIGRWCTVRCDEIDGDYRVLWHFQLN